MRRKFTKFMAVVLACVMTVSGTVFAFADTNDELLAQYYAALAKQQGNTSSSTDDQLAQYYAALAKQQEKANTKDTKKKKNGKPVIVNDNNFEAEVLDYQGIVVVDFYADWCGPCQQMKPIMEKIAKDHPEYKIVEMDVDTNWIPYLFEVESIPYFMIVKNGEYKDSFVGSCSEKQMLKRIKKYA